VQLKQDQLNSDQLNIDTPELVAISLPVAGIGSRFIAVLVDHLLWAAAFLVIFFFAVLILPNMHVLGGISPLWGVGIVFLLIFLFMWGYFALFEAFWNGRTPGKHVAKIRVIHRSGRASRQHQRLGDMVAGTLVVREQDFDTPHWGESGSRTITEAAFAPQSPFAAPHLSVTLSTTALGKLSGSDLEVLEGFFARRLDMDLDTRAALAERIALALRAKSGLEFPAGVSIETFLEAVAHQLREVSRMR